MERNTMQRGTDSYDFRRQALFKCLDPFDFTEETSVESFVISGVKPYDTNRRIIFEVEGKLYYFTNDGITPYPHYGELADILQYGNTVAELLAVEGVPQWTGKRVYPIIAFDSPANAMVMPRLKIGMKVSTFNDIYQKEVLSPEYDLHCTAKLISLTADKVLNGYAQASLAIRLKDKYGQWGEWENAESIAGKEATAVQFKVLYTLTTLDGSDEAQLKSCTLAYTSDSKKSAADTREIVTKLIEYPADLSTVYAMIKHGELIDCNLKAYVTFKKPYKERENLTVGLGTGKLATYRLGAGSADTNIDHDSLVVKVNGVIAQDYFYNTTNSTIDINAPSNATVTASYNYNISDEEWRAMTLADTANDEGLYTTRFVYRSTNAADQRFSAVKFVFERLTGTVEKESLGDATGKTQRFCLPHRAKADSLNVEVNSDWTFDETSQLLDVTGAINVPLKVSYEWAGEFPTVELVTCGWAAV